MEPTLTQNCALYYAQHKKFKTARFLFPKISRYGPQASARNLSAIDARHTFQAATLSPRKRPLTDLGQRKAK